MPRIQRGFNHGRRTRRAQNLHRARQQETAPVDIDNLALQFDRQLQSLSYVTCRNCKVATLQTSCQEHRCMMCSSNPRKFTGLNNLDPGLVPSQLQDLLPVEQMLIAKIQPVMRVYQLRSSGAPGQYRYQGNIINFAQDISDVTRLLPRHPRSLTIVLIRRASDSGFVEFRVRRQKVIDALLWLKMNNILYADIEINNSVLDVLPENGSIEPEIDTIQISSTSNNDFENDMIVESAVPIVTYRNQPQVLQHILDWPAANPAPINEFRTEGYIAMAFPHLFPRGKASFLDNTREIPLTFKEWCKYLMHYHDGRFAKDPRFRFFCLNTMQRHDSIGSAAVLARKSDFGNMSIDHLREEFQRNPRIANKLMAYGAHIRGSNAYWFKRRNELEAMCSSIGAPTMFLTLSSADLWWPCMQRHFSLGNQIFANESEMARKMQKALNDNPLIADRYFAKRVEVFFEIFKKMYKVKDFWYRTEYQHRGSPHVHCLIWLEDAPDIRTFDSASPEQLREYTKYYDNIVSAFNPGMSELPAAIHPSRNYASEFQFCNNGKRAELLNRVQRHTQHSIYCLRKTGSLMVCRFKYPKKLETESKLSKNERGLWEYIPKRNDPLLDDHNPFTSHVWRANTDCKIVTSLQMVVNYLAKYAAKGEPTSQSFRELFIDVLQSFDNRAQAKSALQSMLIKIIGQRDISAPEVMRLVTGEALYHSSRDFVTLFLSNDEYVLINPDRRQERSTLTKYLNRPTTLAAESLTLYQFAASCNLIGNPPRLSYYRKHKVVQVLPKVVLGVSEEQNELYFKQKVLLASSFRNLERVKTHPTWQETFSNYEYSSWNFDGEPDDDEEDDFIPQEIDNIPWMALAGVVPQALARNVLPGEREIDRQFNWFAAVQEYGDIVNNINFIQRSKETNLYAGINRIQQSVVLNQEQQEVINNLIKQFNGLTTIKRSLILGAAGVGKSVVINEIVRISESFYGSNSVLVVAPTGCAADNIKGQTIHSALKLNIKHFADLNGEAERNLQMSFENIRVVVCDEISMCGQKLLAMMDKRLRQSKPENQDEPFGGVFLYLCGDLAQLLPVMDRALFMPANTTQQWSVHGRCMFERIEKVFLLKTVMRQIGQEQEEFRNVLSNIANGSVTESDYSFLQTRFQSPNLSKNEAFNDSVHIMALKEHAFEHNMKRLSNLGCPVALIRAQNNNSIAESALPEECQGLENILRLTVGCRVMLRQNLWTEAGLVNGTTGIVRNILYISNEESSHFEMLPACVLVQFNRYCGPTLYDGVVPIAPISVRFQKHGVNCVRKQIPLQLAYAITVHKSQGMTLEQAIVDIGPKEFSCGLTYVALSRVRTANGLILSPSFTRQRLFSINNGKAWQHKRKDMERLLNLQ